MAIASLSPNSVLATPMQVNPQVKTDLQSSIPQVVENSQKSVKTLQTDTITISPQALKMADYNNSVDKKTASNITDKQAIPLSSNTSSSADKTPQNNSATTYGTVNRNI